MSARLGRAARMARSVNRGNRVAAGFPIVDAETLRLRLAEYAMAEKRVEQAIEELGKLRRHIARRCLALADKGRPDLLRVIPEEWAAAELAQREYERLTAGG